jgi:hypothetical protein
MRRRAEIQPAAPRRSERSAASLTRRALDALSWPTAGDDAKAFVRYLALAAFVSAGMLFAWWLQSYPANVPTGWPTFSDLVTIQRDRQILVADVEWNVGLLVGGYQPRPAGIADPYLTQHNWAYFPLTAYVAKVFAFVVRDPWQAMHAVGIVSVAWFLTLVRAERERERRAGAADATWPLRHELLLLFFVLPIGWPGINFVVLPMALQFGLFFAWLRLVRRAEAPAPRTVVAIGILALAVGFSRFQGLVVLAILATGTLVHMRATSLRARLMLAAALLVPIPLVLLYFEIKTGSPFSFYFAQKAWGRRLGPPWEPFFASGAWAGAVGAYDSVAAIAVRALATFAALAYAGWRWLADLRAMPARRDELRLEGWLLAASLLLGLLPFMTGTLLSAHRYLCFAMYPLVASPRRNLGSRLGPTLLLALVFLRIGELVFFMRPAFFAIW